MTCRTYTKKETALHAAYIAFLSVCGVLAALSAAYALCHLTCLEDEITAGFTLFFALLILSVDFCECRAMGARLYLSEEGIGFQRFKKTRVFLKWDEIRDAGEGSIPTPFGSRECLYFCNRVLDEKERADLITLKRQTVHFSYLPKEWEQRMSERLPLPIPETLREKYVK